MFISVSKSSGDIHFLHVTLGDRNCSIQLGNLMFISVSKSSGDIYFLRVTLGDRNHVPLFRRHLFSLHHSWGSELFPALPATSIFFTSLLGIRIVSRSSGDIYFLHVTLGDQNCVPLFRQHLFSSRHSWGSELCPALPATSIFFTSLLGIGIVSRSSGDIYFLHVTLGDRNCVPLLLHEHFTFHPRHIRRVGLSQSAVTQMFEMRSYVNA